MNTDGATVDDGRQTVETREPGHYAPPAVLALRRRQARNLLALLFLANGTPMLRAGDEFLQTQGGNDNPYNQDGETSWLDCGRLETNGDFFRFARLLIALRKAHPSIARSRFWRDDVEPGDEAPLASRAYVVDARAVVVLVRPH